MAKDEELMTVRRVTNYYHYIFDNTHRFAGHRHACWELNIVLSGTLEITYGDDVMLLRAGEAFVFAPNIFHCNSSLTEDETELLVLMFEPNAFESAPQQNMLRLDEAADTLVRLLIRDMEMLPDLPKPAYIPPMTAILWDALLVRLMGNPFSSEIYVKPSAILYRSAIQYMRTHIKRAISIREIAAACYVSPATLQRAFRDHTGHGVMHHFTEMRIEAAHKALHEGLSVAEVADRFGYSTASVFCDAFKRVTGFTPNKAISKR